MRLASYFLISITLHFLVLFGAPELSKNSYEKTNNTSRSLQKVKIKKRILKKEKLEKSLNWRSFNNLLLNDVMLYADHKLESQNSGSSRLNLHEIISSAITYPKVLSKLNQKGIVKAQIYIDKSSKYNERYTLIQSDSNFLKVHVRKILRQALRSAHLIKGGKYNLTFEFVLTTGIDETRLEHAEKDLYFKVTAYGGERAIDKVNKGILLFLESYTNFFNLFNYLPHNQTKQQVNEMLFIKEYKDDPYWGK